MAIMALSPVAVLAQEDDEPRRTRIALGPQFIPSYPGSDRVVVRPFIDFSRADSSEDFAFEAADESIGFALFGDDAVSFGPSLNFEGKRSPDEVGGFLPKVGFSVELGGFVQFQASDNIRLRADARQAVSGHDGFIGVLGADYVLRDGDKRVLSIGPRATFTDGKYQEAYFGVRPEDAALSGLPAYDADGGLQALGVTAGYIQQFSSTWGIISYVKYDRLMGDPADSPVVDRFGSKDQFSGGVALSYTFGG